MSRSARAQAAAGWIFLGLFVGWSVVCFGIGLAFGVGLS